MFIVLTFLSGVIRIIASNIKSYKNILKPKSNQIASAQLIISLVIYTIVCNYLQTMVVINLLWFGVLVLAGLLCGVIIHSALYLGGF